MNLVLLTVCICQAQPDPPLSAFVGRDLSKLNGVEASQYRIAFERTAGKENPRTWQPFEPRYLVKYPVGRVHWLSISIYPGYDVPDMSEVEAHTFTSSWKHLLKITMPTGYRLRTRSAEMVHDPHASIDLLKIHVDSVGPS